MERLEQKIEAIIFSSEKPVTMQEIIDCLNKAYESFFESAAIQGVLDKLLAKYSDQNYSFELTVTGGGYYFLSKAEYHDLINIFLNQRSQKRLSTAAMETLAIIAYKQPITKNVIEQIRGVNCDYTVSKLLEKELITIAGREEAPGKPILYATSDIFMDYFGINSVEELPKPKDLVPREENEIGEKE